MPPTGAQRGLRQRSERSVGPVLRALTQHKCRVRSAAVIALARELGLEAPLEFRRRRLRTARGIHWFRVYPWGEIVDHRITVDSYPMEPLRLAQTIGHELVHALDAERIMREHPNDGHAWQAWTEANARKAMASTGYYEDQEHEARADLGGAILSARILRDCITVIA